QPDLSSEEPVSTTVELSTGEGTPRSEGGPPAFVINQNETPDDDSVQRSPKPSRAGRIAQRDVLAADQAEILALAFQDYVSRSDQVASKSSFELEQLLREDLKEAIAWTDWDQQQEQDDRRNVIQVGVAGAGMAMISVGYIAWALRGGALTSILSSTIPAWRFVDPVSMLTAYQSSKSQRQDHAEQLFRS
ncbi:MAG: hypothetical protein AAGJ83_13915, partial [Planctomycetota bacterium]